MAGTTLLELNNLACYKSKGQPIFTQVNLKVHERDILVLQGKSGSGKSTLLKCISHLNVYEGNVLYRGSPPQKYGIPAFRTRVQYVPQRASLLPGTPRDFLATIATFRAQHSDEPPHARSVSAWSMRSLASGPPDLAQHPALALAESWGVQSELWDRTWTDLSGGEAQRVVLAIAVGVGTAEVLLLDEPTSALDAEASEKIERHLVEKVLSQGTNLKALVWITHSSEQGQRVGSRFVRITEGGVREEGANAEA